MSNSCNEEACASCNLDCGDRKAPADFHVAPHRLSHIKHIVGVVSGKGGVGKSLVTSLLAVEMQRKGYKVGILDGDITGPSIPRSFGLTAKAGGTEDGILPVKSGGGIPIISVNLLLPRDTDPVVWRGPVISGVVKQFWTDVIWGELDYLFIDMPPGTGDVPLTIFQTVTLDGIIVVSSAQELVGMIVEKAINMAEMMNIPTLALVENMSYFVCPDCSKQHRIFGESHIEDIAARHNIETICRIPIYPAFATATDAGKIEECQVEDMDVLDKLTSLLATLEHSNA